MERWHDVIVEGHPRNLFRGKSYKWAELRMWQPWNMTYFYTILLWWLSIERTIFFMCRMTSLGAVWEPRCPPRTQGYRTPGARNESDSRCPWSKVLVIPWVGAVDENTFYRPFDRIKKLWLTFPCLYPAYICIKCVSLTKLAKRVKHKS